MLITFYGIPVLCTLVQINVIIIFNFKTWNGTKSDRTFCYDNADPYVYHYKLPFPICPKIQYEKFCMFHRAGKDNAEPMTDYIPVSQSLTFSPGDMSKQVKVTILDDRSMPMMEGDETFKLALRLPDNAKLGRRLCLSYLYCFFNTKDINITLILQLQTFVVALRKVVLSVQTYLKCHT